MILDSLYQSESEEQNKIDLSDLEVIRSKIKEVTSELQILGTSVNLTIFRGSAFLDFHNFFCKDWNKKKLGLRYIIKYAGEDGIDDGGVSREFYCGKLLLSFFSLALSVALFYVIITKF